MLLAIVAAGALMAAGCDEGGKTTTTADTAKPAPAATTAAATASEGPTAQAKAEPVDLTDEDVAVPEDFIEEATKDITKDSYKAKLAEVEKEIDSDDE
jgi:hypothetical protein